MDPISKLSADFTIEPNDVHTAKLLLCYILMKLNMNITSEQLYEIAVTSESVNYFLYTEALNQLVENKTILISENNGQQIYSLTDKGKYGIEEFKQYIPKSIRDKTLTYALRYFAEIRHSKEVNFEYIPVENGCYIQIKIPDLKNDLMDLKLFAPDKEQAEFIKNKVIKNPADFYKKIIDFALGNEEEKYELD